MLGQVIGDLLPSALAVALSPVPIVAIVVVLGGARARTSGPAFALGWIAGLLVVALVVEVLVGAVGDADGDEPGLDWFKIAVGAMFLAMAARKWSKRPRDGQHPEEPAWMGTVGSAPPVRAALLGAALSSLNPKNLALTMAAAASIAEAQLSPTDTVVATGAFVALGSCTVAGAVLVSLAAGERATRSLDSVRDFMVANGAVIMMVVLVLLGAKLLGDGLAVL